MKGVDLTLRAPTEIATPADALGAIKTIAVAETAEQFYLRARDREGIFHAITVKLKTQKAFVDWWDTSAVKDKGGNASLYAGNSTVTGTDKLETFAVDKMTVSRWRKHLADFDAALDLAKAWAVKRLEFASDDAERMLSSETVEWYTPPAVVDAARKVLGRIDLDPASNAMANKWIKAKRYFSIEDDSLKQDWSGRVWLNPPYGGHTPAFTKKLIESYKHGSVTAAVLLVNGTACKDNWFQPLFDQHLCFIQPLRFLNHEGNEQVKAPFASVAAYFGNDQAAFISTFNALGAVLARCRP